MTTAPLNLKVRMPRPRWFETLLYGCITWTFRAKHFARLRSAHQVTCASHSLASSGFQRRQRTGHTTLSYAKAPKKARC